MAIRISSSLNGALLIGALSLLTACASGPEIRANVSPTAQLNSYRTYAFVAQPGTNRDGVATPVTGYFKESIQREMESRGYRMQEASPDLLINFSANARENVDIESRPTTGFTGTVGMGYYGYRQGMYMTPMYTGTEVETVRYRVGTANVDVVDAAKKELVWEGIAEGRLSDKAMKDPRGTISAVVTEMFTKYPGRAAAQ